MRITLVGAFLTGPYVDPTARAIERTAASMPNYLGVSVLIISDKCPQDWPTSNWAPLPHEYTDYPHGMVYSPYMIHVLHEFIQTDIAITVQWDGFGFNREKWSDDFLQYDYIGGPWDHVKDTSTDDRVGNGGLSLRSRKWLELGRTAPPIAGYGVPEDVHMCGIHVDHWKNAGCKIAPVRLAQQFSFSRNIHALPGWRLEDSWGFHGFNSPERLALVNERKPIWHTHRQSLQTAQLHTAHV